MCVKFVVVSRSAGFSPGTPVFFPPFQIPSRSRQRTRMKPARADVAFSLNIKSNTRKKTSLV